MKKLQHRNLLNLLEIFDDDSMTLVLMLEYAPHGQNAWLHEDLDEAAKNEFLNVQPDQVTVNPEEAARAVTRVTCSCACSWALTS